MQTGGATLNLALVLWMMALPFRDFVLRDQGGPRPLGFYALTAVHAVAGGAALLFGLFVVLRGHDLVPRRLRFERYLAFMRTAFGLYLAATILGVLVYLTWFVWIPNPPQFF